MRNAILLILAAAVAVGACRHPMYGQPALSDTTTTKAPGSPEPKMHLPPPR